MTEAARRLLDAFLGSLDIQVPLAAVTLNDGPSLPSVFRVSDLAQASIGAAGSVMGAFISLMTKGEPPKVTVERDLASAWFAGSLRPRGWELPAAWDAIAGDYRCSDGWIRLHTNAARHREAALTVLGVAEERAEVGRATSSWEADALETAVVDSGGAAAAMRTLAAWRSHPQGSAVVGEPLVWVNRTDAPELPDVPRAYSNRPLTGVRVLDLTRVLAGPVATRLLAGWGAEVLRIDPPDWDEPALTPEVMLGKRSARLDLRRSDDRERFIGLLGVADVLVHGYRPGALERLGFDEETLSAVRPGLVDVSLNAYGWTGPWRNRRGFDSLVQMSTGIADAGRAGGESDPPAPLPVQALDHATGYLLAASAIAGLITRQLEGQGSRWRTSLARVAELLVDVGSPPDEFGEVRGKVDLEQNQPLERTSWGNAWRLPPPLWVSGAPLRWTLPARRLGSDVPSWLAS
ncbi:MAG: CoA transferase [Acidimicrobiales bacterium]